LANKIDQRVNFATSRKVLEYLTFLDVQLQSFQEFFQLETTSDNRHKEGLFKVLPKIFLSRIQETSSY